MPVGAMFLRLFRSESCLWASTALYAFSDKSIDLYKWKCNNVDVRLDDAMAIRGMFVLT